MSNSETHGRCDGERLLDDEADAEHGAEVVIVRDGGGRAIQPDRRGLEGVSAAREWSRLESAAPMELSFRYQGRRQIPGTRGSPPLADRRH